MINFKKSPISIIIFTIIALLIMIGIYFSYKSEKSENNIIDNSIPTYIIEDENPNDLLEIVDKSNEEFIEKDFVYVNKNLGFSLTLPSQYSNLTTEEYSIVDENESVDFMLRVKCLENMDGRVNCNETIFNIVKFSPKTDISQNGPGGKEIFTTIGGDIFYLYYPMAIGIDSENPQYNEFLILSDWDKVYQLVKEGFREL